MPQAVGETQWAHAFKQTEGVMAVNARTFCWKYCSLMKDPRLQLFGCMTSIPFEPRPLGTQLYVRRFYISPHFGLKPDHAHMR